MEVFLFKYQRLCEVRILHHYLLDDPGTSFDALPAADQERKLRNYDIHGWLDIQADKATQQLLQDFRLVYKKTSIGFRLLAQTETIDQPLIDLEGMKLVFRFNLKNSISPHTDLPINVVKNGNPTTYVFGNEFSWSNGGSFPSLALPAGSDHATTDNCREVDEAHDSRFIGQFEISSRTGMGSFSLLNGGGAMQDRVFELHIKKT